MAVRSSNSNRQSLSGTLAAVVVSSSQISVPGPLSPRGLWAPRLSVAVNSVPMHIRPSKECSPVTKTCAASGMAAAIETTPAARGTSIPGVPLMQPAATE